MKVQEIEPSLPEKEQVQIKMTSSRINPVDMDLMKGFPTLKYKTPQIGGIDGAGVIIGLGAGVDNYNIGDEVFFYRKFTDIGTWAEKICISVHDIALIPENITVQQAGEIALPLLTAYEGLMSLKPKSGKRILIHGAGGGVGFQAVQLADAMGLKVIANASERDIEKLKKVGVAHIINYKKEDFSVVLKDNVPDYIFDIIGKDTLTKSIELSPKKVVSVAFPDTAKMNKTGVQLPWYLKIMMQLMNRKFIKSAKKHQVELIGQVTGANGENLRAAAQLIENKSYFVPKSKTIRVSEIATQGLYKSDIGKVILF